LESAPQLDVVEESQLCNEHGKRKLSDLPALVAFSIMTTTIALIVALVVNAPLQVTAALAVVLTGLGLYIKQALS
jgi:hypothetical protein